jgi:hypothetical protein
MVLQREPASAVLWGTGELLGELEAVLECSLQGIHATFYFNSFLSIKSHIISSTV